MKIPETALNSMQRNVECKQKKNNNFLFEFVFLGNLLRFARSLLIR